MNKSCNIGNNLRLARETLGIKATELSDKFDIPYRTYQSYERGERNISFEKLAQIVQEYNFNLNFIFFGEKPIFSHKHTNLRIINPKYIEIFKKCGHRIIQIQEKNDLTNKEMAKIMGVSEGTYMKICAGNDTPNEKELNKIKENFDVDMDWLMYGDYDEQPNNINTQQNQTLPPLTPEQYQKLLNLLNNQ